MESKFSGCLFYSSLHLPERLGQVVTNARSEPLNSSMLELLDKSSLSLLAAIPPGKPLPTSDVAVLRDFFNETEASTSDFYY
ncbi:hypothetical protein TRIUR3_17613 [Triticum urartu]|uniref:Uncharacterized protein n=1 Tax=Triticum urartu TaxID=4572 RepID=M7Z7C0_TRIUA|nr:hypothetical protein TRIUR3_17613 [Triticum urartu]